MAVPLTLGGKRRILTEEQGVGSSRGADFALAALLRLELHPHQGAKVSGWVRIATALAVLFAGVGLLVYVIAVFVLPEGP